MSDSKDDYSDAANDFVSEAAELSSDSQKMYAASKERERRYGDRWNKNQVNLNEIVEEFAPDAKGLRKGVKFLFEGSRYVVETDMASGYLRIFDKVMRKHVTLDGKPGKDSKTHFKIMKRKDMWS